MSTVIRDLWPEDIKSEDVISPEEILSHQARQLETRTNGLLVGRVARLEGQDRMIIGFEVEAPRVGTRVRLFEVTHRLEFEYPVAIDAPDADLPHYLKRQSPHSASGKAASSVTGAAETPSSARHREATNERLSSGTIADKWDENEWIASSPAEFSQKVETLLARPAVKGIVLSLLSRASRAEQADDNEGKKP